jgi:hypothetical protein
MHDIKVSNTCGSADGVITSRRQGADRKHGVGEGEYLGDTKVQEKSDEKSLRLDYLPGLVRSRKFIIPNDRSTRNTAIPRNAWFFRALPIAGRTWSRR